MKYKNIYLVYHSYITDYTDDKLPISERKDIGFYSNKSKARDAIQRHIDLPGFNLYPNNFVIEKKRVYLGEDYKDNVGLASIYSLEHESKDIENDCYDVTRIGIFANKDDAINKKKLLISKPPYMYYPNGFDIFEETIDEDVIIWYQGFKKG